MSTERKTEFDGEATNKLTELLAADSLEQIKTLLETNPADPMLLKRAADLLAEKSQFEDAAAFYRKATKLYAEAGKILLAITLAVHERSLIKASYEKTRDIYAALRKIEPNRIPSYDFFARMSYGELTELIQLLEISAFPAQTVVRRPGENETELFFVVSGVLRETTNSFNNATPGNNEKDSNTLRENDFFGDIHPLNGEKVSCDLVETITDVELLKISRYDLVHLAEKHPSLEIITLDLLRTRYVMTGGKSAHFMRETPRYQLQTKVTLKILPDSPNGNPMVINGLIEDMSLGGACICLGEAYWSGKANIMDKNVNLSIKVSNLLIGVDVMGTIAWRKEVTRGEHKEILIGIKFKQITKEDFEFLKRHCYMGDGEQEMICSLWESYMRDK